MLCTNCSKLSSLYTNKRCMKCQGDVIINISVLCEFCSLRDSLCSACLKKINRNQNSGNRGCNCGK